MDTIFRFGRFEADRERHQLTCSGRRIKLERIPLELLFLLLEERGRAVTREQIVARLWGNNLVLDTERSINTAIRKLRKALADNAKHPELIGTLVGKGYRFLGTCTEGDEGTPLLPDFPTASRITGHNHANWENGQIRLADFRIEASTNSALLTCNIVSGGQVIGRLPFARLEFPRGTSWPLQPEDKLLMKVLGSRVKLTPDATRALQAFCINLLQNCSTTQLSQASEMAETPYSENLV